MIIDGERILLRPWTMDDIIALVDGLESIEVTKWMASIPHPYDVYHARLYIEWAQKTDGNNRYSFAIVLKETNEVIGGTEISNINTKDGIAGGGLWINPKYHGHAYGIEAFSTRNKYCFEELKLRKIENGYFPGNISSKKMQEKLGYKEEGIRRKHFLCLATGEYMDEVITGLLKDEFIEFKVNKE